jgi:hypothetical protein
MEDDTPLIPRETLDAIAFDDLAPGAALPPLTPGEVLLEEFMRPAGLTARALAAESGVPAARRPRCVWPGASRPKRSYG